MDKMNLRGNMPKTPFWKAGILKLRGRFCSIYWLYGATYNISIKEPQHLILICLHEIQWPRVISQVEKASLCLLLNPTGSLQVSWLLLNLLRVRWINVIGLFDRRENFKEENHKAAWEAVKALMYINQSVPDCWSVTAPPGGNKKSSEVHELWVPLNINGVREFSHVGIADDKQLLYLFIYFEWPIRIH